jgi:hypothetical protein
MNKIAQTIIIAIFLAALIFLITIVGIFMLIVVSAVGIVIALLIERARNKKKRDNSAGDITTNANTTKNVKSLKRR